MKKLFISLAILLMCVAQVGAQSKEATKALKSLTKAKELVSKKGDKSDSWIKLGDAYRAVYEAPIAGLYIPAQSMQVKLLLSGQPVLSQANKEIGLITYAVDTYADKELYFDQEGNLRAWNITKPVPVDGDPLQLAMDAFRKADQLGGSKDLVAALRTVSQTYWNAAMSYNTLGEFAKASAAFENCYASKTLPNSNFETDTLALYYAAMTATLAKDANRSINLLNTCMKEGYNPGELYALLSENYKQIGDTVKAIEVLSDGFKLYPASQDILISLINIYIDRKENPNQVIDMLHEAQKNDPKNASLYYVEGNVYKEIKQYDKAIEMFRKASSIAPDSAIPYYNEGATLYEIALDLQQQADAEQDQAKFDEMLAKRDDCLKQAIQPFEKAFELGDDTIKLNCSEYLKALYFRFIEEAPENKAYYDKYVKYSDEHNQE